MVSGSSVTPPFILKEKARILYPERIEGQDFLPRMHRRPGFFTLNAWKSMFMYPE